MRSAKLSLVKLKALGKNPARHLANPHRYQSQRISHFLIVIAGAFDALAFRQTAARIWHTVAPE
jgi:hypothetical protein